MQAVMRYLHRCNFCGLARDASSATIVSPHCRRCGCVLEAVEASAAQQANDGAGQSARIAALADRFVKVAIGATALGFGAVGAAAAWQASGPELGVAAVAGATLAVAPLIGNRA